MIHPQEWGGFWCIKKVADTGLVASGGGAEVEGGQGVVSGRAIQEVSKQERENRYQGRLISRLSRGYEPDVLGRWLVVDSLADASG